MVRTIWMLAEHGREVRGLLKRSHAYEDSYLPKKADGGIFLPIRELSADVRDEVELLAAEARIVDTELRKNKRTRSYRRELQKILPKQVYKDAAYAYEQVGDVGIITVFESMEPYQDEIGQALMDTNKGIRLVVKKAGRHEGEDRLPAYEILTGSGDLHTVHKESGVELELDLAETYFSARTFEERKRIASCVRDGERVLVGFSGVGPYPLVIARHAHPQIVVGVEHNSSAHEFAVRNAQRNSLSDETEFFCDEFSQYCSSVSQTFDRIVLPHPTAADTFFEDSLGVASDSCTLHLYLFARSDSLSDKNEEFKMLARKNSFVVTNIDVVEQFHLSPTVHKYCFDISLARKKAPVE